MKIAEIMRKAARGAPRFFAAIEPVKPTMAPINA